MMLSLDIDTMDAILASRPVLVSSLDPRVLRFGLRGRKLSGHDYLFVDERILDAIAEAGADAVSPIVAKRQALP